MSVTWNYDGAATLTATVTGATSGHKYRLSTDYSSFANVTASSGTVILTVTDIAGLSAGETFGVWVQHNPTSVSSTSEYIGANVFTYGTADTTGTGFAATWAYNSGTQQASVTFTAAASVTYGMGGVVAAGGAFQSTTGGPYTAGSSQTLTVTFSPVPDHPFQLLLYNNGANSEYSTRLFTNGVTDAGSPGNPETGGGGPTFFFHTLLIEIHTLDSAETVDITSIALTKNQKVRHNQTRAFTVEVPAGDSLVTSTFSDGFPRMEAGDRKLVVWRDGVVIHHGRIFNIERTGDANTTRATITSYDPLMELGYDADGRAGRPVRDETGNFIDPTFNAGGSVTAGDLVYQILTNSQQTGTESDPNPGEGGLPIHMGTFNTSIDVSPVDTMDWPVLIGDFLQQLLQTNLFDIYMRPVDPAEGLGGTMMVSLNVLNTVGTDRTGTVHFDYFTGSKNAVAARWTEDFSIVCNKLYDYLGPRIDQEHWKANITPGSPGTTVDPTVSRSRYGTFMQIREFDSVGTESSARPLYMALWNGEAGIRLTSRNLLFLTPSPDSYALFEPTTDYEVGDLVAVNVGGDFGVNISATQRVYGYDREWSREGVETVTSLIVSADQE